MCIDFIFGISQEAKELATISLLFSFWFVLIKELIPGSTEVMVVAGRKAAGLVGWDGVGSYGVPFPCRMYKMNEKDFDALFFSNANEPTGSSGSSESAHERFMEFRSHVASLDYFPK